MDQTSGYLVMVVLSIGLFLLCREIVCWYFKLNKIASLLEDIKNLLQKNIEKK